MDCYNQGRRGTQEKLGYRLGLLRKRLTYHRSRLREGGFAGAFAYLRPRLIASGQGARERAEEWLYGMFLRFGLPLPAGLVDQRLAIRRAAAEYDPPDWPGSLDLFCVEEPRAEAYDYPEMGWQGKALGGTRMHQLPGSHRAMLSSPCVQVLANQLRDCMAGPTGCGAPEPFVLGAGNG